MENQTHTENRKHKDSLFVDYFSKDRDWKQHFLSLYNALHGTNLQVETTKLERVNLEQVLYMDYYNDIAVMVNDQFILMIEHQSTINPNMPLRLLEYVTRIYGNRIDSKTKFSNQLIPLAKPEFIVFYTGKENIPPESYLYLSDAFPKDTSENQLSDSELTLELKVKVCKIKGEEPSQIVQNCPDLEQYVQFLKLIDKAKADGQAQPLTRAIREAVHHNILKDYLERKGGETLSILTAEY
ncbi:MAG: Rpn family recombination-promoting nuclease/putative transposase, partial [Spirochaetaceae bacterium]|nr:Rpn family recombination-promoting nuclease/putative transposase [Spirochaetaceae bacterium]